MERISPRKLGERTSHILVHHGCGLASSCYISSLHSEVLARLSLVGYV